MRYAVIAKSGQLTLTRMPLEASVRQLAILGQSDIIMIVLLPEVYGDEWMREE